MGKAWEKAWETVQTTNWYLWAAGLGFGGVLDAVTPGSAANHLIGLGIVFTAVYIWSVQ